MSSSEALANALRPTSTLVDKPAVRAAAEVDTTVPAHIAGMRATDHARTLYGVGGLRDVEFERAFDGNKATANELRNILADYRIADSDGQKILARAIHAKQGTAGNPFAQQEASRRALKQDHGNADDALLLANRLINRDPRMNRLLSSMGVGNDPEVVAIIADAARRERARGRLV